MSNKIPTKATRLVASSFAKYSSDLIGQTVRKFDISIAEMVIIALVFVESTRPLREDSYLASKFGFDHRPLPNEYRLSVSLKFIHTSLGLSRETARRKLGRLVERGLLARINGGYVYHITPETSHFSAGVRATLVKSVESMAALVDRLPSPD